MPWPGVLAARQQCRFGAGWLGKLVPGMLHAWWAGTLAPETLPPEIFHA